MASKVRRGGRSKGKIKLTLASKLVQKNDKTRVRRKPNNTRKKKKDVVVPQAPARLYNDNGANFIIKIRRK